MNDFDTTIEKFRNKELNVEDWNFCISGCSAYIMGEGVEQCLAYKDGFNSKEEIKELYQSLGVKYILPGV